MKRLHMRIERLGCGGFSAERVVNGILWERVTADQQAAYRPK